MDSAHITRQMTPHNATACTIGIAGTEIAALDARPPHGTDATALLVPGYTGSKEDFAPLLDRLSASGFRVVAIDQRGQHESPGTDDADAYSASALGADVVQIAHKIGTPLHLVGHSFGGLIARAAVLQEPAAFASVTLMSSGPSELPPGPRRSIIEASEPHLHSLGLAAIYDIGQQRLAEDPTWSAPDEPLRSFLRNRFIGSSAHALQHMGHTMLREPDRVAELKATAVPAMVLYGRHDNAWSPRAQSDMAHRLAAREVIIDDAMHSPAIENPTDTAAALESFWRSVSSCPAAT